MSTNYPNNLKTSPAGIAFIKRHEALRLKVYLDIAGFKTVGWGHKLLKSQMHLTEITLQQAEQFLIDDVTVCELFINGTVRMPLTQYQFDALVSFCFNLGVGALDRSTLLKQLQVGKYMEAAKQFIRWCMFKNPKTNKHEKSSGLLNRRSEETELFKRGKYD